jgi:hypothetical protein
MSPTAEAPSTKQKFESKRIPPEKLTAWMALARERFTFAKQLDDPDRKLAEHDANFAVATPLFGGGTTQWEAAQAQKRIDAGRPCLTENRLPTFTAQVVNDGRQSKPAIKISAMDNGTKETAEFLQGRIRQIEYECNADIAYDTSREQQVTCGRGFLRVTWEYVPHSVRKKRAKLEPINNQFSVLFGPSQEYDCSDADYCFVISYITLEEHKRRHGTDTIAARTDFASLDNPAPDWLGSGPNAQMVQEAEYWVKEWKPRTRVELSNGKEYWQDELPDNLEELGITVEHSRQDQDCTVVQYIIDGCEIQDETEFIGPWIGIVPVWGREWFVDGKRRTSSLIRYAKEPQRLLNLYVSNIAEQIAQMPKSPWWIPVGGIPAGMEAAMANLSNDARAYALYNQYDPLLTGRPLNPPARITNEPPIMALVAGYNQAVDAIKAAMGIYDSSLGNVSNETSGIAINSRKRESDNANFHFPDNEGRSRKHIGRILLYMIAEFDVGIGMRAVRGEDGKTRMVQVGKPYHDEELNKTVHHDLTTVVDGYQAAVDTGLTWTSQRAEAAAAYGQIAAHDKNFMGIAGDIYMRSLDMPGSDEIADRYKLMLPPPLQKQKQGANQIPPQVAQQFQQMQAESGAVIEGLTKEVQQLRSEIDSQMVQVKSRERICELQEQTKRDIAFAELNQDQGLKLLQADIQAIKHRLELQQADEDQAQQAQQAQQQQQNQSQQADQQRQHDAQQADAARSHEASQAQQDREHQMALAQMPTPSGPAAPGAPAPPAGTGEAGSPESQPQE